MFVAQLQRAARTQSLSSLGQPGRGEDLRRVGRPGRAFSGGLQDGFAKEVPPLGVGAVKVVGVGRADLLEERAGRLRRDRPGIAGSDQEGVVGIGKPDQPLWLSGLRPAGERSQRPPGGLESLLVGSRASAV